MDSVDLFQSTDTSAQVFFDEKTSRIIEFIEKLRIYDVSVSHQKESEKNVVSTAGHTASKTSEASESTAPAATESEPVLKDNDDVNKNSANLTNPIDSNPVILNNLKSSVHAYNFHPIQPIRNACLNLKKRNKMGVLFDARRFSIYCLTSPSSQQNSSSTHTEKDCLLFFEYNLDTRSPEIILGFEWTSSTDLILIFTNEILFLEILNSKTLIVKDKLLSLGTSWYVYSNQHQILALYHQHKIKMIQIMNGHGSHLALPSFIPSLPLLDTRRFLYRKNLKFFTITLNVSLGLCFIQSYQSLLLVHHSLDETTYIYDVAHDYPNTETCLDPILSLKLNVTYTDDWKCLPKRYIEKPMSNTFCQLRIDLYQLAMILLESNDNDSAFSTLNVFKFVSRRKSKDALLVSIRLMKQLLDSQSVPPHQWESIFDLVLPFYHDSNSTSSPTISPVDLSVSHSRMCSSKSLDSDQLKPSQDILLSLFENLNGEETRKALYISECLFSLSTSILSKNQQISPTLQLFWVKQLLISKNITQLAFLLQSKIIQSHENIANLMMSYVEFNENGSNHILKLEKANKHQVEDTKLKTVPFAHTNVSKLEKLGIKMMESLGLHKSVMEHLILKSQIREAVHYAIKHSTMDPWIANSLLEKSVQDKILFFHVFKLLDAHGLITNAPHLLCESPILQSNMTKFIFLYREQWGTVVDMEALLF